MAIRTWSRSLLVALGVSLLAGAGELGIAYGLGILRFTRSFGDVAGHWPAQLVWVAWFAMQATVVGALFAERYARHRDQPVTAAVQATIVVAAAMGATVVAPLSMLPASHAQVPAVEPVLAVAVNALFGTLVGAVAAVAVLQFAPVRWNVATSIASVWLLALLSVAPSLGATDPLPAVRLGAFDAAWLAPETAERLAMLLLPGVALLTGAAVAAVARRRGRRLFTGGASGVAGPLLIAVAYLLAGPGRGDDGYQSTPYRAALLAVLTGALGAAAASAPHWPSVVAAPLRRWSSLASTALLRRPAPDRGRSRAAAIEPTEILRPLPVEAAAPLVRPAEDTARPAAPPAPPASEFHPAAPLTDDGPVAPPAPPADDRPAAPAGHPTDDADPVAPVVAPGRSPVAPPPDGPPAPNGGAAAPGGWDWPSPPGTARTVSTGSLDWSLPPARRPTGRTTDLPPAGDTDRTAVSSADQPPVDGADQFSTGAGDRDPTGAAPATRARELADGEASTSRADSSGQPWGTPLVGGLRRLRGLLRRDGGDTEGARDREEPALPPHDEEYVDWVAQLGQSDPAPSTEPGVRRSLRSGARHQRD